MLGGDALAAEMLLLTVISRILTRHGEAPLGKLTLNLSACPPPAADGQHSPVFEVRCESAYSRAHELAHV